VGVGTIIERYGSSVCTGIEREASAEQAMRPIIFLVGLVLIKKFLID